MMGPSTRSLKFQDLNSLTARSTLTLLLRAMYRAGVNHCVLPPGKDFADTIVFTKEQLVSIIERSSSEAHVSDVVRWVAQKTFKPAAVFKPDFSSNGPAWEENFSELTGTPGITDMEGLQVLTVEHRGARVTSLKEALSSALPEFPEWWEAPIPFAMYEKGRLFINNTATLMFGSDLQRISTGDFLDKDEFMVTLEGSASPCSVMFQRLEEDIFLLEDCTGDIEAAEDIAWWAALGKAWLAKLDRERRIYRRCDEEEAEILRNDEDFQTENDFFPCEWEDKVLGYLCVEKENGEQADFLRVTDSSLSEEEITEEIKKEAAEEVTEEDQEGAEQEQKETGGIEAETRKYREDKILKALGPQTMGLLAPTSHFAFMEDMEDEMEDGDEGNQGIQKTQENVNGGADVQENIDAMLVEQPLGGETE